MPTNFITGNISLAGHLKIFRFLLLAANTIGLFIYSFVHLIFFDFPFEPENEILILLRLFAMASSFAVALSVLLLITEGVDYIQQKSKSLKLPVYIKLAPAVIIALIVLLSACNAPLAVGIKKDFTTGLSSSYSGMEPEKVMLVMNNEILNHTDIPLGESFLLVNDGIKGLQVKNGKVTIGCLLKISDQKGKVLLEEKDLFEGHDVFEEKDAQMLKCTVSTGKPMEWEEKYNVAVTFWDKNGTGKIENKVTIRSIDMP